MASAWTPEGMSQEDFMQKDQCILLDMNDNVIGEPCARPPLQSCPAAQSCRAVRAFPPLLALSGFPANLLFSVLADWCPRSRFVSIASQARTTSTRRTSSVPSGHVASCTVPSR